MTVNQWIEILGLKAHPEGGHYREVYRSSEFVDRGSLPDRFDGDRTFSTAIYFLLEAGEFSALHRIRQDEVWHFYDGSPLTIHVIEPSANYRMINLGRNVQNGEAPLAVVPAGCWFGANVSPRGAYSLVGCTVAPGFEFGDFELAERKDLLDRFPQHRQIIEKLAR